MEILVLAIVGGCAAGLIAGGSLESLARTTFRWAPLLAISLLGQVLFLYWSPGWLANGPKLAVLLALNALVAVFLVLNRKIPGTLLAALGLALNVVVIGANGAMPVSAQAAERAGVDPVSRDGTFIHEPMDDDTRLPLLADALAIPFVSTVYSLGDLYLALGIFYLTFMRTRGPKGRHSFARDGPID